MMSSLGGVVACFLVEQAKGHAILDTFLLDGGLGAGKTCFARGFIQKLMGENTVVPSPTFTLVQSYERDNLKIFHYDLYRINNNDSLYDIGWEDVGYGGISLIEWPERMGKRLYPKDYWHFKMSDGQDVHERKVSVKKTVMDKSAMDKSSELHDYLKAKNVEITY